MICGRCGQLTAAHSAYCPRDKWVLWQAAPERDGQVVAELATLQLPRGVGGFLARRRDESRHTHLAKDVHHLLAARLERLETHVEASPDDAEAQSELGLVSLLDNGWARANAHFVRARTLRPPDVAVLVNHAAVLAHSGKWALGVEALETARKLEPHNPIVLFNLALGALGAHRPQLALEALDTLQAGWRDDAVLAQDYWCDALSARGMALLQMKCLPEGRIAFEAALRPALSVKLSLQQGRATSANALDGYDEQLNKNSASASESREVSHEGHGATAVISPPRNEADIQAPRAELLINLALIEAQEGEISTAISHLAASLRLAPGHPRALNNLGVLAYRQNELRAAQQFLELARQMEEAEGHATPQVLSHLGITLAANGLFSEGIDILARASSQEHAEFMVFYNTGRAYIAHGKPERGIEFLRHAFALKPQHPDVYTMMGAAYLFNGRADVRSQAQPQLQHALQFNAKHRTALVDLSMGLREEKDTKAAREALEHAVKTYLHGPETLFLLGLALMSMGDEVHWAQAAKVFENARQENGEFPAAHYNSALCQHLMGMRDTSAKLLEEVTRADPAFGPAYYLMGVGHAAAKHYSDALEAWKKAEKYEPDNPDLHANIGFIYYRRGDYPNAIKHFSAAHRIMPGETLFLIALGLSYARSQVEKALPKAIQCFQRALEINEYLPIAHMNVGLAYFLHNKPEVAITHWRRVSQLDSDYYKRIEEAELATGKRSYDDTIIQLRPLNWRARIVGLAPVMPPPHTELLPGDNVREFRLIIDDPQLAKAHAMQRELRRLNRVLAWGNAN